MTESVGILLRCEGMGDCLCAIPILRKLRKEDDAGKHVVLFTHHPELFQRCPYVDVAHSIRDADTLAQFPRGITLFDTTKLPYHRMDTIDFMSIPVGMGQLSFREKQLEYFAVEEDEAERFDVVLNTSMTWASRSWPIDQWQGLAERIVQEGFTVAVVGKDVHSSSDAMVKVSKGLTVGRDLTNRLSLDQTYYTIRKAGIFVTCQNGLSVLSGATDTEVVVLDRSIEWSKYALYRHEDPHFRFTLVKGECDKYCCLSHVCHDYGEFRCIPSLAKVWEVVRRKLEWMRLRRELPAKLRASWSAPA
jgi:ADP-heptose:LPS heptosyltransferase